MLKNSPVYKHTPSYRQLQYIHVTCYLTIHKYKPSRVITHVILISTKTLNTLLLTCRACKCIKLINYKLHVKS